MEDKSRIALDLIRHDHRTYWVWEQLAASLEEGITQSAKERVPNSDESEVAFSRRLTARERAKRETYETSRPYEEHEKIELIAYGLKEVFMTIPAVKLAAISALQELGSTATTIEFSTPQDEGRLEDIESHVLAMNETTAQRLAERYATFRATLVP